MYTVVSDGYYGSIDLNKVLGELEQLFQIDAQDIKYHVKVFIQTWNRVMSRVSGTHAEFSELNTFLFCALLMLAQTLMNNRRFLTRVDCIFRLSRGKPNRPARGDQSFRVTVRQTPQSEQAVTLLTQHKSRPFVLLDCMLMMLHTIYIVDFVNLIKYKQLVLHNPTYGLRDSSSAAQCTVYVEHILIQIIAAANSTVDKPLYDPDFVRTRLAADRFGLQPLPDVSAPAKRRAKYPAAKN